jgi:S-adenosylmethionine:tRNA-ribosyltransferase-isomerase (queuine synthetase)
MKYLLLISLIFIQSWGFATEVVWLKLKPMFSYKDLEKSYNSNDWPTMFYIVFEVNANKVLRAALKDNDHPYLNSTFYFTSNELKNISLHKDSKGRHWLRKFNLNEKQLIWVTEQLGKKLLSYPYVHLKSCLPSDFEFSFDIKDLGESLTSTYSNQGRFHGKTSDGLSYNVNLFWVQEQY